MKPQALSRREHHAGTSSHRRALAILRMLLGGIFLWSFLDKLLGLGFNTPQQRSVLAGASPTQGYLDHLDGWLAGSFASLAGLLWVDLVFMVGLAGLGLALLTGVALRASAWCGTVLLLVLWVSTLPLRDNPLLDQHIIYAAVLFVLATGDAGRTWGLAVPWRTFLSARAPKLLPVLG